MQTATLSITVGIGGMNINSAAVRTAESINTTKATPLAGEPGELTTRTDDDTGVITLDDAGHGITTQSIVDVYWSGGSAYGFAVTAVNGAAITIDIPQGGDNLPVLNSQVVVGEWKEINWEFLGNDLQILIIGRSGRGFVHFIAGASNVLALEIAAGESYLWTVNQDVTNPLAAETVDTVHFSCGDEVADTVEIGLLLDTVT